MSFTQELASWLSPAKVPTSAIPSLDSKAPSSTQMQFPRNDEKPVIATFLRHTGCPFAEKTFLLLRKISETHGDVHFVAVSHSDKAATDKWLEAVGGTGSVEVIVDHERTLYSQYGLGVSSAWHVLNPWSMSDVFKLGREEKIWNRPTESGSRWQTAGTFAVDSSGTIKYVEVAQQASDNGDFEKALQALGRT